MLKVKRRKSFKSYHGNTFTMDDVFPSKESVKATYTLNEIEDVKANIRAAKKLLEVSVKNNNKKEALELKEYIKELNKNLNSLIEIYENLSK